MFINYQFFPKPEKKKHTSKQKKMKVPSSKAENKLIIQKIFKI